MGYKRDNDEWIVAPEEADIIRRIYQLYLEGSTLQKIKEYLEDHQIKTATGKDAWATAVIQKILKNEKFKGDSLLQKTYTEDFITSRKSKNVGQREHYYITNSHPAIITAKVFDKVQEEMSRRARLVRKEDGTVESSTSKYSGKYLLGNLLVCGDCGASYRRRKESGKVAWRCATRIEKGKDICPHSPTLDERWVKNVLVEKICENRVYKEEVVKNEVDCIFVFSKDLQIHGRDESIFSVELLQSKMLFSFLR